MKPRQKIFIAMLYLICIDLNLSIEFDNCDSQSISIVKFINLYNMHNIKKNRLVIMNIFIFDILCSINFEKQQLLQTIFTPFMFYRFVYAENYSIDFEKKILINRICNLMNETICNSTRNIINLKYFKINYSLIFEKKYNIKVEFMNVTNSQNRIWIHLFVVKKIFF